MNGKSVTQPDTDAPNKVQRIRKMVTVRPMTSDDHSAVLRIAQDLHEWFDEHARTKAIPTDLRHQHGFVAEADGRTVGFITLFVADGRLNIGWLAVLRSWHGQGIGTRLVEQAERMAESMQLDEIATYTLGDGVDYPPYEKTRSFYVKRGFTVYQRNTTDNPTCPEEIKLSKRIG